MTWYKWHFKLTALVINSFIKQAFKCALRINELMWLSHELLCTVGLMHSCDFKCLCFYMNLFTTDLSYCFINGCVYKWPFQLSVLYSECIWLFILLQLNNKCILVIFSLVYALLNACVGDILNFQSFIKWPIHLSMEYFNGCNWMWLSRLDVNLYHYIYL